MSSKRFSKFGHAGRDGARGFFIAACCFVLGLAGFGQGGCGAAEGPPLLEFIEAPTASLRQGLCNPGDSGGDLGCGCTLNSQCNRFDDDTRLIVCDVPMGKSAGSCIDCLAKPAGARPIGCACTAKSDCATGLACNGRTCQLLRQRGEYCFRDSDCGSDANGSMICLPTKSWCGPLEGGNYCDFNSDCLSGRCVSGLCTPGGAAAPCTSDSDCTAPLLCHAVLGKCLDQQPDGEPCSRNAECKNQCNSFSGSCMLGKNGVICTPTNNPDGPHGDCMPGLECTNCGGSYTCRMPGGPCG